METIGFIKLSYPYPTWLDDIETHISQNNFGIDTLQGLPFVRRTSETLNFVKDDNPTQLMLKTMNILLNLAVNAWRYHSGETCDIVLHFSLIKSNDLSLEVKIHCDAYRKSF